MAKPVSKSETATETAAKPKTFMVEIAKLDPGESQFRSVDISKDPDTLTLAEAMKSGQLTPILVRPGKDGRYTYVAGFRRVAAAKILGWTEIEASYAPDRPDYPQQLSDMLTNAAENTARKDISVPDRCVAITSVMEEADKRVPGFKMKKISEKDAVVGGWLGIDRSTTAQYRAYKEKLAPEIFMLWRTMPGVLTMAQIKDLAAKTHEVQRAQVSEIQQKRAAQESGEGGEKRGRKAGQKSVRKPEAIREMVAQVQKGVFNGIANPDFAQGFEIALSWVLGEDLPPALTGVKEEKPN